MSHLLRVTVETPSSREVAEPKTLCPQPAAAQGDPSAPSPPLHTLVSGTPKPPQGSSLGIRLTWKDDMFQAKALVKASWPLHGDLCFPLTVIFTHPYDVLKPKKCSGRTLPSPPSGLLCSWSLYRGSTLTFLLTPGSGGSWEDPHGARQIAAKN